MQNNNSQAAPVAQEKNEELSDTALTTTTGQLSLLDFGGFTDPLMTVFRINDSLDAKTQALKRQAMRIAKRKEIAVALNLTKKDDKDKLDKAILEQRDTMKAMMVAQMNRMSQDPNWTGGGMVVTKSKNGSKVAFELITCARKAKISDEDLAEALSRYTGKPVTVEQVKEMRRREEEHLEAHDVSTKVTAAVSA